MNMIFISEKNILDMELFELFLHVYKIWDHLNENWSIEMRSILLKPPVYLDKPYSTGNTLRFIADFSCILNGDYLLYNIPL